MDRAKVEAILRDAAKPAMRWVEEVDINIGEIHQLATLALEALEWRENVGAMLGSGDPDVIRCHEGGGPENLVGSLALTMIRTRGKRDAMRRYLDTAQIIGEPFAG